MIDNSLNQHITMYRKLVKCIGRSNRSSNMYFSSSAKFVANNFNANKITNYHDKSVVDKLSSSENTSATSESTTLGQQAHDQGAVHFLKKVYKTTGVGIVLGLSTAHMLHASGIALTHPYHLMGVGFVGAMASIATMSWVKCEYLEKDGLHYSRQPIARLTAYGGLCVGMGATIAPMVSMYCTEQPMILPMAVGISAATMFGASMYAYMRPHNALSAWRGPLAGCLTGCVAMGLASIGSTWMFGPNAFSEMWWHVDMYAGVVLFSAMTSYDTYAAVKMYEAHTPDHIECATSLYLNFMNLLIRFMEIIGKFKKN
jgi:FtsH-binding integral membrane protein